MGFNLRNRSLLTVQDYTQREFRGRGLAQACTSAVVAECLRLGVRDVVLNVNQGNAPAICAYERLGFRAIRPFYEVIGMQREA